MLTFCDAIDGGKPPVPPPPQEEKFIDLEPMRDMVEVVKKVVKHQVREKTQAVLGHLWKGQYSKFSPCFTFMLFCQFCTCLRSFYWTCI